MEKQINLLKEVLEKVMLPENIKKELETELRDLQKKVKGI